MLVRALPSPSAYQPTSAADASVTPGDGVSSTDRSTSDDGQANAGAAPKDKVTLPGEQPKSKDQHQGKVAGQAQQLTPDQVQLVDELKQRDQQVRSHEAAHQAAGGSLAGGASFSYQTGPDGRSYAVGGEVPISMSTGRTPEETIAIARQIRAAALAPADPSPQDLQVAGEATAMEFQALQQERQLSGAAQKSAQAQKATEARGTHLHSGEPCLACSKATEQYAATATAA